MKLSVTVKNHRTTQRQFSFLGAWGKVKKGWDISFERLVAIKIMRKRKISRKIRDGVNKIYR